jgi:HK97 gp10 family phage protein
VSAVAYADVSRLAEALKMSAQQSGITTQQVLIQASNHILAEMESRVPVRSGELRRSLQIKVETDKVTIGPNTPYAGYVEFGTQPHEIRPKSAGGVLVFTIGGRKVFTKKVHHPGTKAQPYVRPAFEAWVDSLGTMAAEANVKVITDHAS